MNEKVKCCLCGITVLDCWSHNPYPLCEEKDYESRCCGDCNAMKVMPARMEAVFRNK